MTATAGKTQRVPIYNDSHTGNRDNYTSGVGSHTSTTVAASNSYSSTG